MAVTVCVWGGGAGLGYLIINFFVRICKLHIPNVQYYQCCIMFLLFV